MKNSIKKKFKKKKIFGEKNIGDVTYYYDL